MCMNENYENKIFELETDLRNKKNYIKEITKEMTRLEVSNQHLLSVIEDAIEELNKVGFINGAGKCKRALDILNEVKRK